jgi:hypothetical protein
VRATGTDTIFTHCASDVAWLCFCSLQRDYSDYFDELSTYVHTLCRSKKNLCAKDAYIPFDMVRGLDTGAISWVQIGDYNQKKRKVAATQLADAIVGFNILTYKWMAPGSNIFSHSYSRTFDYADGEKYFNYYPAY